jgi:hypothetical protein
MQDLTVTEMEQVNGAGGGIRVGSDGANNIVGNAAVLPSGASQPLGGRIDPGGANNAF